MSYKGRCVGRLKDFLEHYYISDGLTFEGDAKSISRNGKKFITYEWERDTDIPTFVFVNPEHKELENRINSEKEMILELFGYSRGELWVEQ
jgi:hypothetical protein